MHEQRHHRATTHAAWALRATVLEAGGLCHRR
jgi:hypothetical protein